MLKSSVFCLQVAVGAGTLQDLHAFLHPQGCMDAVSVPQCDICAQPQTHPESVQQHAPAQLLHWDIATVFVQPGVPKYIYRLPGQGCMQTLVHPCAGRIWTCLVHGTNLLCEWALAQVWANAVDVKCTYSRDKVQSPNLTGFLAFPYFTNRKHCCWKSSLHLLSGKTLLAGQLE